MTIIVAAACRLAPQACAKISVSMAPRWRNGGAASATWHIARRGNQA